MNTTSKFRTGIGLSPVYSFFNPNRYKKSNSKLMIGFSIGLKEEFNFHKNIGITTGIEYLNYGLEFGSYFFDDNTHKLRIHEIQIPLTIRFNIPQFYFFGGVVFIRYPLKANEKIYSNTNGQLVADGNIEIHVFKYVPFFAGTIVSGIGKKFKIKNKKQEFFIELQYKYAINALNYGGIPSNPFGMIDLTIKNSFLLLTFGVYLNQKNKDIKG